VMCAGVTLLTQTTPATMKADVPDGKEGSGQHGPAGQSRPAPR
jgi:hypothetical protein